MKDYDALSPEYKQLVDELADLEHKQWWSWTIAYEKRVDPYTAEHWKRNWKAYDELPEYEKDKDRLWAMCVLDIITKDMPLCRLCGHDPS